jgi:hypothetical protein
MSASRRLFDVVRRIRPRDAEFYCLVCRLAEEPVPEDRSERAPRVCGGTFARTDRGAESQLTLFPRII